VVRGMSVLEPSTLRLVRSLLACTAKQGFGFLPIGTRFLAQQGTTLWTTLWFQQIDQPCPQTDTTQEA
jgi:hypothetical protein